MINDKSENEGLSEVSLEASGTIIICEYANFDSITNKANIMGAFSNILLPVNNGEYLESKHQIQPFSVLATVLFPYRFVGHEFSLTLELRDEEGKIVYAEDSGRREAVRVSQIANITPIVAKGVSLRLEKIRSRHSIILSFPTGLMLNTNQLYSWVLQINSETICKEELFISSYLPGFIKG